MGLWMKKVTWHIHARVRLSERSISPKMVIGALEHPEQMVESGDHLIIHKRYYDIHKKKEYLLRIFVQERAHEIVVCSAYRTSKISKYWEGNL